MPDPESAEARTCQETVIVARASQIGGGVPDIGCTRTMAHLRRCGRRGTGGGRSARGLWRCVSRWSVRESPTGPVGAGCWALDPTQPQDVRRLLQEAADGLPWKGVVHLWSLDTASEPATVHGARGG